MWRGFIRHTRLVRGHPPRAGRARRRAGRASSPTPPQAADFAAGDARSVVLQTAIRVGARALPERADADALTPDDRANARLTAARSFTPPHGTEREEIDHDQRPACRAARSGRGDRAGAARRAAGRARPAGRPRLRRGAQRLERDDRPPAGADRALHRHERRDRRDRLRAQRGPDGGRARRQPQRGRATRPATAAS